MKKIFDLLRAFLPSEKSPIKTGDFEEVKKSWGMTSLSDEKSFLRKTEGEALAGMVLFLIGLLAFCFLKAPFPIALVLGLSQLSVAAAGLTLTITALWHAHCLRNHQYIPCIRWLAKLFHIKLDSS